MRRRPPYNTDPNRRRMEAARETRMMPGVTKEQTDLVEQRLERAEQKIEALREQQKKLRP